jgi:glycosyltransferase involved in cell wall biosynthesis
MGKVVVITENLPVPFARRVWQGANALKDAGWQVTVICPANEKHSARHEVLNGIHIYRHWLPLEARGALGFLIEYSVAIVLQFWLLLKVWRRHGFDIIQASNPPDILFLVALPFKLFGKKFVFDHHDVCPELYVAKFGRKGFFHRALGLAERLTFRTADLVISTNETFREIAMSRGGKRPEDVVTVYSIPSSDYLCRVEPDPELKRGCSLLVGYVGIIGDQDGVDHLVEAVAKVRTETGFTDFHTVIVGDGPALESVKARAIELGVEQHITFTGYAVGPQLMRLLSTFDIGVIPDPINEYNDKISMNKVFEYSAFSVPAVAYPLQETRRLLGDTGTFADDGTSAGLARALHRLLIDPELRARKAIEAKQLADTRFQWENERAALTGSYARFVAARDIPGYRERTQRRIASDSI